MPIRTRAAVLHQPGRPLVIETLDLLDPGPGDVLIRLAAASLCHSDLSYIEGKFPHPMPMVLGHEGIGTVVATGAAVEGLVPGDTVMPYLLPDCGACPYCRSGRTNACMQLGRNYAPDYPTWFRRDGQPVHGLLSLGTFAEHLVVPQDQVQRVRADADPARASCIGCGVTTGVGSALLVARIEPGSSVAVFGLGGVGLSAVQGARIAGATTIVGVDVNPEKEAAARAMGATHFVDARTGAAAAAQAVHAITGIGADYAFECAGRADSFEGALASLSTGGWATLVTVGIIPDDVAVPLAWSGMMGRNWRHSLMGGAKRSDVARYVDWMVEGRLDLGDMVSQVIGLDAINDGFDLMRAGRTARVVIRY